jgi:hypothetical protein
MASKTLICPGLKVNASTLAAKRFWIHQQLIHAHKVLLEQYNAAH